MMRRVFMPVGGNLWTRNTLFHVAVRCRPYSVLRVDGIRKLLAGVCMLFALLFSFAWAESEPEEPTQGTSTVRELTLDDAYRLATTNDEQVKIAGSELAKAQLLPWRAIALLTPRTEIDGTLA